MPNKTNLDIRFKIKLSPLYAAVLDFIWQRNGFCADAAVEISPVQDAMRALRLSEPVTPKGVNATLHTMYKKGLLARLVKPGSKEYRYYLPGLSDLRKAIDDYRSDTCHNLPC